MVMVTGRRCRLKSAREERHRAEFMIGLNAKLPVVLSVRTRGQCYLLLASVCSNMQSTAHQGSSPEPGCFTGTQSHIAHAAVLYSPALPEIGLIPSAWTKRAANATAPNKNYIIRLVGGQSPQGKRRYSC